MTDLGRNYTALPEKYRMRMPAFSTSPNSNNGNGNSIAGICNALNSPTFKMLPYRLLYNGKELQLTAQTRLIDYGFRQYDPAIARWNGMDPMAEKYYKTSGYAFCGDNPVLFLDPNGPELFITGNLAAQAFEMLQKLVKNYLILTIDKESGKILFSKKDNSNTLDENSSRLVEIINDKSILVNIQAKILDSQSEGGEFYGNYTENNIVYTEQRVDPYKLRNIEDKSGDPAGKNLMHEITESYEGAVIAKELGLSKIMKAYVMPVDVLINVKPSVRKILKELRKEQKKHYKLYEKAHRKATKQTNIYIDDDNKKYVIRNGEKVYL